MKGPWQRAFERTLAAGGRFHFNLTGLDDALALGGDPNWWVDRYTAWELQQIVRNVVWFRNTTFYLDGAAITSEHAERLGVVLHE